MIRTMKQRYWEIIAHIPKIIHMVTRKIRFFKVETAGPPSIG